MSDETLGQTLAQSEAQVDGLAAAMENLNAVAGKFGSTLTSAFARGIVSGKSFEDVLRGVGQKLIDIALNAALKPAQNLIGSLFSGLMGSVGGMFGGVKAFADGGVVAAPTYFPMSGGAGLMGEAGPEAIIPLARGADGKLGVRAGGGASAVVNVHITTPDAESFRRSEAQLTASLARAVARGRRGL